MAVTLRFDTPLDTGHPVDLIFNAPASPVSDSYLALNATRPRPTLLAYIDKLIAVGETATRARPTMLATFSYDNAVYRGPNGIAGTEWQDATEFPSYKQDHMQDATHTPVTAVQPWQDASKLTAPTRQVLQFATRCPAQHSANWADAEPAGSDLSTRYEEMTRVPTQRSDGWKDGEPVHMDRGTGWQDRNRTKRPSIKAPWQVARRLGTQRKTYAGVATPMSTIRRTWWQDARHSPPGYYGTVIVTPPVPPCYVPPDGGHVALRFADALTRTTDLIFRCRSITDAPAMVLVPVRRTYIVINDVHLKRVDGDIELPTFALTLNIDMDSWTWGFTASLPATMLSNLTPGGPGDPVELEAIINGTSYRLLAEGIARDRSFPKSRINLTGRGKSAILAAPYGQILTFTNTEDRTAQQLMNDALTIGGVTLGWDVDWRITDWLVPAGVWNFQGTYMEAVNAIAAAAGAFIQPDPVAQTLRVRARYPSAPWDWGSITPDIELPSTAITKESVVWSDKPGYNAVYVSGATTGGVLCSVKRTGTAGDVLAQMITDALITEAAAGRQRGIQVLSDAGREALYSLSLPVLDETGVIDPGTMVRYVDDGNIAIGIVKGVSVNVSMPSVRQTIEVEVHA